tara:strand:- start:1965 stop:2210 length:246 start_codon:yes stop_codon:yes gene_type:complete
MSKTIETIVWSKMQCPYCDMAKALLKQKNIEFEERKIGAGWTIQQLLESHPNVKSVPQIILNGKYIGGYQELKTHFETEGK